MTTRIAIDMLLVRRDIRQENIILRWVDARQMLVDSLTKISVKPDLLRATLKSGQYIIVEEGDVLKRRERERLARSKKARKRKAWILRNRLNWDCSCWGFRRACTCRGVQWQFLWQTFS